VCQPFEDSAIRAVGCSLGGDGVANPGDTCTVSCKNGFDFRGNPLRTCQDDGTWSGDEILCRGTFNVTCDNRSEMMCEYQ